MTDLLSGRGTRTSAATVPQVTSSRTRTIDDLVEEVGHNRNVARLLGEDIAEAGRQLGQLHHRAFDAQLNTRARDIARRPQTAVLEQVAGYGFAWRDIARMLGVSVPALRRWRQGEPATGRHLWAMARLLAFAEILRQDHLVANVAAWMEIPLVPEAPLTGVDLAASGRLTDLLDLAAQQARPEDVLDAWQPGWRERYRSDFEVFEATDGEMGIRPAARSGP